MAKRPGSSKPSGLTWVYVLNRIDKPLSKYFGRVTTSLSPTMNKVYKLHLQHEIIDELYRAEHKRIMEKLSMDNNT
jgi:hypothetical protein